MNEWEQAFAKKMEGLQDKSAISFERFVREVVDRVFARLTEFLAQWDMRATAPQAAKGLRTFKFAVAEDGYALVSLRLKGFDSVVCEHECWVPGGGRVSSGSGVLGLRRADERAVEECFRQALDDLACQMEQAEYQEKAEMVMA
jgi:hypothetical protein